MLRENTNKELKEVRKTNYRKKTNSGAENNKNWNKKFTKEIWAAEERIWKSEDRTVKIIQSEKQEKKCRITKWSNNWIIFDNQI